MWIDVSCPRCGLNRRINGVGTCVCRAVMIYKPSPRTTRIEIPEGYTGFRWWQKDDGTELVHPDDGEKIKQERGNWLPVQTSIVLIEKKDRRRTARSPYRW